MSADERPYITCQELLDFLYLYLENELPDASRHEFERHLSVCDACRDYIRQYETAIRLGKSAYARPDDPCGEETPEELAEAILRSREKS